LSECVGFLRFELLLISNVDIYALSRPVVRKHDRHSPMQLQRIVKGSRSGRYLPGMECVIVSDVERSGRNTIAFVTVL